MEVFDTIPEARARAGKNRNFPDTPNQLGVGRVAKAKDGGTDVASFTLPGQRRSWFRLRVDVPANLRAHFRI